MKLWGKTVLAALTLALVLVAGTSAAIERADLINGTYWTQWSNQDKLVYLRGLGNWADFVAAAQAQRGNKFEFGMSKVLVDQLRNQTLGQIVSKVDTYYRDNPDKLSTSVIEVVLRRCTNVCPPEGGAKEKKQ